MFEGCIYFSLNATFRKVERLWEAAFKETGLSPAHGYLLHLVLNKPGMTQAQIGEQLSLERSTVTRFLEALEKKRLLKRVGSSTDSRAIEVYPTEKGKEKGALISAVMAKVSKPLDKKVNGKKMDELLKLLGEVRGELR